MNNITKYLVYGPNDTLRRLPVKLLDALEPKYLYTYTSPANKDEIYVAVYEQFEKQINATITQADAWVFAEVRFQKIKTSNLTWWILSWITPSVSDYRFRKKWSHHLPKKIKGNYVI